MDEQGGGKKEPVKVVDRRTFTADGKKRGPEPGGESAAAPGGTPSPPPAGVSGAPPPKPVLGEGFTMESPPGVAGEGGVAGEDAAFLNLVISLYNTGCVHLGISGEQPPDSSARGPDLEGARSMIELLAALKRKSRGNLSTDESRIIESLLADLQMAYVMKAPRS